MPCLGTENDVLWFRDACCHMRRNYNPWLFPSQHLHFGETSICRTGHATKSVILECSAADTYPVQPGPESPGAFSSRRACNGIQKWFTQTRQSIYYTFKRKLQRPSPSGRLGRDPACDPLPCLSPFSQSVLGNRGTRGPYTHYTGATPHRKRCRASGLGLEHRDKCSTVPTIHGRHLDCGESRRG